MKIVRNINGDDIEFELTHDELRRACAECAECDPGADHNLDIIRKLLGALHEFGEDEVGKLMSNAHFLSFMNGIISDYESIEEIKRSERFDHAIRYYVDASSDIMNPREGVYVGYVLGMPPDTVIEFEECGEDIPPIDRMIKRIEITEAGFRNLPDLLQRKLRNAPNVSIVGTSSETHDAIIKSIAESYGAGQAGKTKK